MNVVNLRNNPKNCIKVDRSSPWGNPFVMGKDGDRNDVCDLYEQYALWRLSVQPTWLDELKEKKLDLACWCAPQRCHADTLRNLCLYGPPKVDEPTYSWGIRKSSNKFKAYKTRRVALSVLRRYYRWGTNKSCFVLPNGYELCHLVNNEWVSVPLNRELYDNTESMVIE